MNTKNNENEPSDLTDLRLEGARIALHDAHDSTTCADAGDNLEGEWAAAMLSLDQLISRRDAIALGRKSARTEERLKRSCRLKAIEAELMKLNQHLREHYGARAKVTFQPDWARDFRHSFYWSALGTRAREVVTSAARRYVERDDLDGSASCRHLRDALAFVRGVSEQLAAAPSAGRR